MYGVYTVAGDGGKQVLGYWNSQQTSQAQTFVLLPESISQHALEDIRTHCLLQFPRGALHMGVYVCTWCVHLIIQSLMKQSWTCTNQLHWKLHCVWSYGRWGKSIWSFTSPLRCWTQWVTEMRMCTVYRREGSPFGHVIKTPRTEKLKALLSMQIIQLAVLTVVYPARSLARSLNKSRHRTMGHICAYAPL